MALAAFLVAPAAQAAGDSKKITLAPPSASAEHTVIHVGPLALKIRTSAIVLGITGGPSDGAIFGTTGASLANASSFAEARQSGVYSVAGSARAALTLSFDLSEFLSNVTAHIPIPLGGGRPVQAALSLEAGGRLSLNVGSSFGFSSAKASAPDQPGGHFSMSANALKPWKRLHLRWRYTFY
ncbi:MAG TPA: hypothetical protein VN681_04835 [Stellaceae bacterium]|nr:hypothetical protein [Stellaceae bacterium]